MHHACRFSLDASHARAFEVREESGLVIRRGTIMTDTPLYHRLRGYGEVMVQLAVTDELLERWKADGITEVPMLRNHGLNADGGWFFSFPNPEADTYGFLREFAREPTGTRTTLAADFCFSKAQAPDKVLEAARTTPYIPTSGGFDWEPQDVEVVDTHENGLPLVRMNYWRLTEGSVTVVGRDPTTAIRAKDTTMPFLLQLSDEQVRQLRGQTTTEPSTAPPARAAGEAPAIDYDRIVDGVVARLAPTQGNAESASEQRTNSQPPAPDESQGNEKSGDPPERDEWAELEERATAALGAERALEIVLAANGSLSACRTAVKLALATREKPTPSPTITGGDTGSQKALQVLVHRSVAMGLPKDEQYAGVRAEHEEKARAIDRNWRQRGVIRTARDVLLAHQGYDHERVYSDMGQAELLSTAARVSSWAASGQATEDHGGPGFLYYRAERTHGGGLVPANLPAAYQDIAKITLYAGHDRYALPLEVLATRQDTPNFRKHRLVEMEAALAFKELETHESYKPVYLREQESTVQAKLFGHKINFTEQAIVDDELEVLVYVPLLLGQLYAEGKTATVVAVVARAENFTADQRISADPLDYSEHMLLAVARARQQVVIHAPEGEEEDMSSGKTLALTPTAGLWGEGSFNKWFARTRELNVGDGISDRAAATVHEPLRRLRDNMPLAIHMANNQGVIWPGPGSMRCPLMVGGVRGRTGLHIAGTNLMNTGEQYCMRFTVSDTFYATVLDTRKRYMYKLTDQSLPAAA